MTLAKIQAKHDQQNLKFDTAKKILALLEETKKEALKLGVSKDEIDEFENEILELVEPEE